MAGTATATMPGTLTAAQITSLLASGKKRGEHPATVRNFINSGEVYKALSSVYYCEGDELKKKQQGLKIAYQNLRNKNLAEGVKTTPAVEVVWDDESKELYLINKDALAAMTTDDHDAS